MKVLIFSFFAAVLTSVLWLAGVVFWASAKLADVAISALALNEIAVYGLIMLLPVFMIWFLWAMFYGFCQQLSLQKQIAKLSLQINKNQEYTDVIAQNIIKGAQQHSHAFALGKIEMYIRETNEILADILQRYHLLNEKNMIKIWETVKLGNHWGFARAFIDLRNSIPDFEDKITSAARKEKLLSGSLTEFCARYTKLLHLLKEHDEENIIQEVIETGVYGRVFTMFAPIVQKLQEIPEEDTKNAVEEIVSEPVVLKEEECFFKEDFVEKIDSETEKTPVIEDKKEENKMPDIKLEQQEDMPEFISSAKELKADKKASFSKNEKKGTKKSFWNKFLKENEKEDDEDDSQIDPLSLALRRSFGAEEKPQNSEPVPEEPSKQEDNIQIPVAVEAKEEENEDKQPENNETTRFAFANTDETLKNLQKEWAEMQKADSTPSNSEAEKQNDE